MASMLDATSVRLYAELDEPNRDDEGGNDGDRGSEAAGDGDSPSRCDAPHERTSGPRRGERSGAHGTVLHGRPRAEASAVISRQRRTSVWFTLDHATSRRRMPHNRASVLDVVQHQGPISIEHRLIGRAHDQCAVEPALQLHGLIEVRVVPEGACVRNAKPVGEDLPRTYRTLDPVGPVHGRWNP